MNIKFTCLLGIIVCSCQSKQDSSPEEHKRNDTIESLSVVESVDTKGALQGSLKSIYNDTTELIKTLGLIKTAAENKDNSAFSDNIHPQLGCYIFYRPGSQGNYGRIDSLTEDVFDKYLVDIEHLFTAISSSPVVFEKWPSYVDCGYDGFSKDGAFAEKINDSRGLSNLIDVADDAIVTKEEIDNIQKFESLIGYKVIWTQPSVIITFLKSQNKWYIATMTVGFDCS